MYAILGGVTDREQRLAAAAARYRELQAARDELIEAIRDADSSGMRQVDILKATDHVWTREQVRRICLPKGEL